MLEIFCVPVRTINKHGQPRLVDVTYDRNLDGDLPILTIDEQKYLCEESIFDAEFGVGRAFQLGKQDPQDPECYSVFVGCDPNGTSHYCDCRGFSKGGYCKHVDVLAHLITRGIIDDPRAGIWEAPVADDDDFWEQPEALPEEAPAPMWVRDYEFADASPFSE